MKISVLKKYKISSIAGAFFFFLLLGSVVTFAQKTSKKVDSTDESTKHVKVFYEDGKYGGWPANGGMWNWGNEILVGYTVADHKDKKSHTYDVKSSIAKFSRSLDGGKTWTMEDAYQNGITEATWEHNIEGGTKGRELTEKIDFTRSNFALTFRMRHTTKNGTSFYYTYDRGKTWQGPFELKVNFPGRNPIGIVSRTDYIVDGKYEMTAFITVAFKDEKTDWREVACVRSKDGGITWEFLSWIGPEKVNSIMPSSLRLGPNKLITIIRRTKPAEMVSYISEDNGKTWNQANDPVKVDFNGHPPALVKLKDGRLCMVYGIRQEKTMANGIGMYITYSSDEGKSWDKPELFRGNDGANWDIGYPRAVVLPDGKVVTTYYYNNASDGNKYRYIAASILTPKKSK